MLTASIICFRQPQFRLSRKGTRAHRPVRLPARPTLPPIPRIGLHSSYRDPRTPGWETPCMCYAGRRQACPGARGCGSGDEPVGCVRAPQEAGIAGARYSFGFVARPQGSCLPLPWVERQPVEQ